MSIGDILEATDSRGKRWVVEQVSEFVPRWPMVSSVYAGGLLFEGWVTVLGQKVIRVTWPDGRRAYGRVREA